MTDAADKLLPIQSDHIAKLLVHVQNCGIAETSQGDQCRHRP